MNDKQKIEKALVLLYELIELAEIKDEEHKKQSIAMGKGEEAVGESFSVFYLKMLRKILEGDIDLASDMDDAEPKVVILDGEQPTDQQGEV
tara:strand:+ start:2004 stop:2276 length:273 start_codon:yes stop_codon:yes gene_type:complete